MFRNYVNITGAYAITSRTAAIPERGEALLREG